MLASWFNRDKTRGHCRRAARRGCDQVSILRELSEDNFTWAHEDGWSELAVIVVECSVANCDSTSRSLLDVYRKEDREIYYTGAN